MTLIRWTNSFIVYDPSIDAEHREIVDIVNALFQDVRDSRSPQVIESHLSALAELFGRHFVNEERLMKATGYSRLEEHHRAHASMTQRTVELLDRFRQGEATMTLNQMQFLKAWLCTHIQESDTHFGSHLAGTGSPVASGYCSGPAVRR